MREISPRGLALIQGFESFRPRPYLCPAGYWTIGYGHVILVGEKAYGEIMEIEGLSLLLKDVSFAERSVVRLIKVPLFDGQFDALVSFIFNLGSGALQRSTLRMKVNREEHKEVPDEFMKWVRAGGIRLRGLIRRRMAEAILYMEEIG